jgi:hypothetical protein
MGNNTDLYYIGAMIDNPAVLQRIQRFSDHVNGALGIDCSICNERNFMLIPPFYATNGMAQVLFSTCWASTILNKNRHPLLSSNFSLKGLSISNRSGVDIVYFEVTPRNRQQYFDYVDAMRAKIAKLGGQPASNDGYGKALPKIVIVARPSIENKPCLVDIIRTSYLGATLSFTPKCPTLFSKRSTGEWVPFSLNLDLEER